MSTFPVETVKLADLQLAFYNPRKIQPKKFSNLKKSIAENGVLEPLVVNKDGTIIAGHQRYRAAIELELETIPCIRIDVDKNREKLLNLQLNNLTGENDKEKLVVVLNDLVKVDGLDMEMTGFDLSDIENMIGNDVGDKDEPEYPITPFFGEKYDYVLIFTKNEVDSTFLKNALGVQTTKSYKSTAVGSCKVVTFEQFMEKWNERASS
jgi:hypothetical protein